MDPLSALGLASNIVQLISFTEGLVSKSHRIYKSLDGSLVENTELEAIARTLQSQSRRIALQAGSQTGRSEVEQDLVGLVNGMRDICKQLIDTCEKLKTGPSPNRWQSFLQALQSVWKEKEIGQLTQRLERYRNQIDSILLAQLKEKLEVFTQTSEDRDARIELNLSRILQSLEPGSAWQADLVRAARQSLYINDADAAAVALSSSLSEGARLGREKLQQRRILESLKFADMRDRYERISEAHRQTFDWIFEESASAQTSSTGSAQPGDSFTTWLTSDEQVYWITGKPGAGKSTLMKFISDDKRLTPHLQVWQKDIPVYTARFFFWNSGTTMQMSRIGLLQYLLQQIVSNFPEEIPQLFPDRWEYQVLFGYDNGPWTWSELSQAFIKVVSDPARAFFFLIDGLDEFDGDCSELASFLLGILPQRSNIKFCLASRPWLVFEDAFRLLPSLRMEDLTTRDIELFASEKLGESTMYSRLREHDAKSAGALIQDVTEMASGVFLWVRLVVKSLLDGLRDGDTVADLHARLLRLPRDLEDLFERMLGDLDTESFKEAEQIFRTVRASHFPWREISMQNQAMRESGNTEVMRQTRGSWSPLTLLSLSFVGEDVHLALSAKMSQRMSAEEQMYRADMMRRRLSSRCRGLLEAPAFGQHGPDAKVQYLHRTVKDFLEEGRARRFFASSASSSATSFDPHLALCAALLRHAKAISPTEDEETTGMATFEDILREFTIQCHWVERQGNGTYVPFLVEMNKTTEAILGYSDSPDIIASATTHVGRDYAEIPLKLPHWTRRVDPYVGAKAQHVDTLFDYAVYRGLTHYVRSVIQEGYSFEANPNCVFLAEHVLEHGSQDMANLLRVSAVLGEPKKIYEANEAPIILKLGTTEALSRSEMGEKESHEASDNHHSTAEPPSAPKQGGRKATAAIRSFISASVKRLSRHPPS